MYSIYKKSANSQARVGHLKTKRGQIQTPFFMPIATRGVVKTLTVQDLERLQPQIILANTYHLYLRPGLDVFKKCAGLHKFMNWPGPILTDSGGFQVFSLSGTKSRKGNLVKVKSDGVEFSSHIDGSRHFFTPEKVLEIQKIIGSDIAMLLDVCTANPAEYDQAAKDVDLTLNWARISKEFILDKLSSRARKARRSHKNEEQEIAASSRQGVTPRNDIRLDMDFQQYFAIVQGSTYKDLRIKCTRELRDMDWDGYAIGGLAVGETDKDMYEVLDYTVPELPEDKPRYLMGVGRPENIIEAVKRGIDMFDCVIPTREARHGRLYIWQSDDITRPDFYQTIIVTNQDYKSNFNPINENSDLAELREYSLAYLNHLFSVGEPLAQRLATLNNLEFYLKLMEKIRESILEGIL